MFFITLSLRPDVALPPGVTLNQTRAKINILDNDGESFVLATLYTLSMRLRFHLTLQV
jgi:hypothetical protein